MSSKRPKTQVTTSETKTTLPPQQQALLDLTIGPAQSYVSNPPELPSFSTVADFDPLQVQGQEQLLGVVPNMRNVALDAAGANRFMTSGAVLDPASNPGLQGTLDAAQRQIMQSLGESILPNIRGEAVTSGQFGSSRQGIAEGIAGRGALDAVGDATSRLLSQNYLTGLSAMNQATALSPQVLAGLAVPGAATSAVGDIRQAREQALLDERAYRDFYEQAAPFLAAQEVAAMASGIPGGSTKSTSETPVSQPNPLMQGLGLGAMLLGGFLSDRRFKRRVRPLGDGQYEFEYVAVIPGRWRGVMVDEHPKAVDFRYGVFGIDYNKLEGR